MFHLVMLVHRYMYKVYMYSDAYSLFKHQNKFLRSMAELHMYILVMIFKAHQVQGLCETNMEATSKVHDLVPNFTNTKINITIYMYK